LELQVAGLFTHDLAGRIVAVNEPGGGPAPRFFLGRTRTGNLWRIRHGLPEPLTQRLETLAAAEPVRDDLQAEPRNLAAFQEALRADREVQSIYRGPAYRFPDTLPPPPAGVTRITRENLHLMDRLQERGWNLETLAVELERYAPMLALVEDGAAVSLCFSARLTEQAAEAGVETLERYRGRGNAPAVVTAWAHAVRATGRIPFYGTSWDNHASRAVARKLGLIMYATDLSLE
jgi:RimJ/RimL family protein N-acetyltransferase